MVRLIRCVLRSNTVIKVVRRLFAAGTALSPPGLNVVDTRHTSCRFQGLTLSEVVNIGTCRSPRCSVRFKSSSRHEAARTS